MAISGVMLMPKTEGVTAPSGPTGTRTSGVVRDDPRSRLVYESWCKGVTPIENRCIGLAKAGGSVSIDICIAIGASEVTVAAGERAGDGVLGG